MPKTPLLLGRSLVLATSISVFLTGCGSDPQTSTADNVAESNEAQDSGSNPTADASKSASKEDTKSVATADSGQPASGDGALYSADAFRMAAHDGKLRVVEMCLESGMNVNDADANGNTPLTMAAYNGHLDVVKLLLKNNATIDVKDRAGLTPLIHAASCPEPSAVETVKTLAAAGADLNAVGGAENWTALMMAAAEGNLEVVKTLVALGADKSLVDTDGESAAKFAQEKGHRQIYQFLSETE